MRILLLILMSTIMAACGDNKRQKRYLIFTPATQWGVFATVSVPLHPETTTSVAWFFEANYFTVDNTTYYDYLLGDIQTAKSRDKRNPHSGNVITRRNMYSFVEASFQRHGYPGRSCVLRIVCEGSDSHFLHNGVLGDLLHLLFTPSTSMEEAEIDDAYYEAEYNGLSNACSKYRKKCPNTPLDLILKSVEDFL